MLGVLIGDILYRELVIKRLEKPNGQRKDNETMQRSATERSQYPVPQKSSAPSYHMIRRSSPLAHLFFLKGM